MKRSWVWLCVILLACPLLATSVLYVPVPESIRLSGLVVKGEVVGVYPGFDAENQIVTTIVLSVEETLKGLVRPGETVAFQAWGGSIGGMDVETVGEASYAMGEKVLVQLEDIDGTWHTLGLSFGKWTVGRDASGEEILHRDLTDLTLVRVETAPVLDISLREMHRIARTLEAGRPQ